MMRVIGKGKIVDFCRKHKDACAQVKAWLSEAENASWHTPQDIKNRYSSVSFLPERIVIFNIRGNHYRLVVKIAFNTQVVQVMWLGTHAEYDRKKW